MAKNKLKKCKTTSVCCCKCVNYNKGICSLSGSDVEKNDVCKSFDDRKVVECDRCHRKVEYKNADEYSNSIIMFSMESGSGSGSGQNVHLCKRCESDAFSLFQDFLERVKSPILSEN